MNTRIIRFTLGPVQSFIESARTSRDLWTGSYLLSWLTACAAAAIPGDATFHSPEMKKNPLFIAARNRSSWNADTAIPCLPNTFTAEVPGIEADELSSLVRRAVSEEWERIAASVHNLLGEKWAKHTGWDAGWGEQIADAWEVRIAIVSGPISDASRDALTRLDGALKHVRGWPRSHEAESLRRPKCSLCGMRSQMNPRAAGINITEEEYECAAGGERLRKRDRFCAVCTVKRFAPAVYFTKLAGGGKAARLPIQDTGTLAAKKWIAEAGGEFRKAVVEHDDYSGGWLHWSRKDQGLEGGDGTIPSSVWERIVAARRSLGWSPRPYFAILMADGDRMGEAFAKHGIGLSQKLMTFASTDVPKLVKEAGGSLIYSGGDDTLALLPLETAIDCTTNLNHAFRTKTGSTLSAGLAVVHYKQDLRESLAAARAAEKYAKRSGRDRLAVAVHPRGGAGHVASLPWDDELPKFLELFHALHDGPKPKSARWLYRVRREVDSLNGGMTEEMLDLEFHRILQHAENAPGAEACKLWKSLGRNVQAIDTMLAAAFIARGGEE